MKKILFICLCLLISFTVVACGKEKTAVPTKAVFDTSMGIFEVKLDTALAPEPCANFISWVNNGSYECLIFHRVIDNFRIQG